MVAVAGNGSGGVYMPSAFVLSCAPVQVLQSKPSDTFPSESTRLA